MEAKTSRSSFCKSLAFSLAAAALAFLPLQSASAVTLSEATSIRSGFQFPLGDPTSTSYDGPHYDAFAPFQGIFTSQVLSLSSFSGQVGGSTLEAFILSESAYFDGEANPSLANNFGVVDSQGNFTSIVNSAFARPGDGGSIQQGEDQLFTVALQSPEALFSANEKDNPDGQVHFIAREVEVDSEVKITPVSLSDKGPLTFQLFAGDVVLFIEDMLAANNLNLSVVPFLGDFDYNDLVVVLRQSANIPEPASMLLLASALLGGTRLRRRSN